jgi:hypothetical protein
VTDDLHLLLAVLPPHIVRAGRVVAGGCRRSSCAAQPGHGAQLAPEPAPDVA